MCYDSYNHDAMCENCIFRNDHIEQYKDTAEAVSLRISTPVKITERHIKTSTPILISDLRIPVISGVKNANIQSNINNGIESDITEFKRQMEVAAKEQQEEYRKNGKKMKPFIISTIYQPTYNKNDFFSIAILYHELINGKNNYIKATYNYDLKNGKPLGLEDLFKPGTDYKSLIDREVRRELRNNPAKYFPGAEQSFKGIAKDQPFYLENGKLVVFFGFNEIAPTEAQIPVFKIPFSAFGDKIKPI